MTLRRFIVAALGLSALGSPSEAHAQVTVTASGGGFTVSSSDGSSGVTVAAPAARRAAAVRAAVSAASGTSATTPPTITEQPADQSVMAGSPATFSVSATGNNPFTCQWYENGTAVNGATQASYTISATTSSDNGALVYVIVTDVFCNMTMSRRATLRVNSFTPSPPTIAITQPRTGPTVSGLVSVQGTAADAVGLKSVSVSIDGVAPASATGLQSWSYSLDTTKLSNGAHQLTASATNTAGLTASASVSITVSNGSGGSPTVTIVSPADGATVFGTVIFNGTASSASGVVSVMATVDLINIYPVNGLNNWTYSVDATKLTDGAHNLYVIMRDAAGGRASTTSSFIVNNTAKPPSIAIGQPANGATVSGIVSIRGTATDAIGLQGISVSIDDGARSAATGLQNWSDTLDTTRLTNASHTISATAADSVGLGATASITVRVDNSGSPPPATPIITLTSPANNASIALGSAVMLSATASVTSGSIAKVDFFVGSTLLGTATTTHSLVWTPTAAGAFTLMARATTAAGATATSAPITVTVTAGTASGLTIQITQPTNGSTFVGAPLAHFSIQVNAAEPGGQVSQVLFFANGASIGSSTVAPYSFSWSGVPAGTYVLTAEAVGSAGATAVSPAVSIIVIQH